MSQGGQFKSEGRACSAVWRSLPTTRSRVTYYDDGMTYSLTLEGMGALVDLTRDPVTPDTMPDGGSAAWRPLTVVSVRGRPSANAVYANPTMELATSTYYKIGSRAACLPGLSGGCYVGLYDMGWPCSHHGDTGNEVMLVETDASGHALKAGWPW